jgi:glycerol-3-phosphate dehydrogenase
MKIYDLLAGKYGFGKSKILSPAETIEQLPTIRQDGLRGGVIYHDGQFDDSRLLISLMATAVEQGAVVLNYASVLDLTKDANGFVDGVIAVDRESNERFTIAAKVVINATGIFADEVRRLAEPQAPAIITPSQGIHLVFDKSFLPANTAVMVPHTNDGRVLFAIPWHEHTLVGTTDTPIDTPSYEPLPFEEEIEFVLETAGQYLCRPPKREDILSVYVGIRPLVKTAGSDTGKTSALSRDHTIHIDRAGLITIAGGKWTTYRLMAEDTVNHATMLAQLEERPCVTRTLRIHGYQVTEQRRSPQTEVDEGPADALAIYGSDAAYIRGLAAQDPELAQRLDPALPYIGAEVVWAVREEMARTLDDILARRTRSLLLNSRAAIRMAPAAAKLLARELGKDGAWADTQVQSFRALAAQYDVHRASGNNNT